MGLLRDPSHVNSLLQIVTRRDDRQVHTAAAIALGLIGDQTAVNALHKIAGAYSMNPSVRSAAINALGKTAPGTKHEASVFKTLRRIIQTDKKDDVRRAAALVLYRFKHKELLETLDRVIRVDRDEVTAGFAMIALAESVHARGDARDRRAARGLFQARLAGGNNTVKGYAAVALGLLGRSDTDCAAVLRPALTKESDHGVRAAVAIGLGLCEDIASRDALGRLAMGRGAQQDLRGYACVALGMLAAKSQDAGISKYLTEIVENVNIP
ncbi:MAG: HEAT repeat domain-containing protein, partial [Planctomycetota bacterium]